MIRISHMQFLPNFLKDKKSPREKPNYEQNEKKSADKLNSINSVFEVINVKFFSKEKIKGSLNISICPGKKDSKWDRDLLLDLKKIKEKKINVIVCLLEWGEMKKLDVYDYPHIAQKEGILFYHLPIKDRGVPDISDLQTLIPFLVKHLQNGYNILVHCRCGLGRSGLVCACCLTHFGYSSEESILKVRNVRKGAIQTSSQLELVKNYCKTCNLEILHF